MANSMRKESSGEKMNTARAMQTKEQDDARARQREIEKLDAETAEEVDALRVNLLQDDDFTPTRDSSGRVVDEVAEETIARFTEVGPLAADRGAISVTPGRDDPSKVLRRHQLKPDVVHAEDLVESNLDEPRDEAPTPIGRKNTAA